MTNWTNAITGRMNMRSGHGLTFAFVLCDKVAANFLDRTHTATAFTIDGGEEFVDAGNRDLFIWDDDSWEFCPVAYSTNSAAGDVHYVSERGAYGSTAAYRTNGESSIARVLAVYSSGSLPESTGLEYVSNVMGAPRGGGVMLDRHEGRYREDALTVEVLDQDQCVTQKMRNQSIVGMYGVLLAGYNDQPFGQYTMLAAGRISAYDFIGGALWGFELESPGKRLSQKLYKDVEDFTGNLNDSGGINDTVTSITVDATAAANIPQCTFDVVSGTTYYAAFALKVGSEIMKITAHGSGSTSVTVERGWLGTTAANHGASDALDLVFAVEDNPIDILLGLLLTKDFDEAASNTYPWLVILEDGWNPLGLGFLESEVDVASFEAVRDRWFVDYYARMVIDRSENIKPFIEKHILKPYGLNLHPTRSGKIGLSYVGPPLGEAARTLTEDDIIGIPDVHGDNTEIINDTTVEYDWDAIARGFDTTIRVIDETSVVDYAHTGQDEIEARLIHTDHRGTLLAPRIARRRHRTLKNPSPVIPLRVTFRHADVDIGDVVNVTHSGLPDPWAGTIGWDERPVGVVGRRVDYSTGDVTLDVFDTGFFGNRYGLIAPSGTVDYTSASSDEKNRYCFISDGTSNTMGDGTEGYSIA